MVLYEGLGPILRIYDERFHLLNRVFKFPFRPLLVNWPTGLINVQMSQNLAKLDWQSDGQFHFGKNGSKTGQSLTCKSPFP